MISNCVLNSVISIFFIELRKTGQTDADDNDRVAEAAELPVQAEAHPGVAEAAASPVRSEQPAQHQPVHQFQHEEQPASVHGGAHPQQPLPANVPSQAHPLQTFAQVERCQVRVDK